MAKGTNVTRVKASDDTPKKAAKPAKRVVSKAVKTTKPARKTSRNGFVTFLSGIGGYFAGAWAELRQVRWPNRRATWGLTLAVILFSVFFLVLITLLDTLFKWLFEFIIG